MNELQVVKSASFGDIQCDIYQGKDEFYMTREQIGAALEYENPRKAIKDIHARHRERLDRAGYSGGRKLTTPSGGTQSTTVYTRKGIMEICRHSSQPKADAFMDWAWDVLDDLITGKTKLVPARRSLGEVNSAARLINQTLKEAGVAPQFRAVALHNIYDPAGIKIPLEGITVENHLFDATAIATKLGVYSKSGNPHGHAVSAIINKLTLGEGEREKVPFQRQNNGHSGTNYQYTGSVVDKVARWLEDNQYPPEIHHNGKFYRVSYSKSKAS